MSSVLINHPLYGSLWLENAEIIIGKDGKLYVVGDVWDNHLVGDPYLPDDYRGQYEPMTFPVTYIRKDPDGILERFVKENKITP